MTQATIAAITALAEALEDENAALTALDIPAASRLLERKRRATDGFMVAIATGTAAHAPEAGHAIERLRSAAERNRRLLERAIEVQGRIVALIARAIPRAAAQGQSRYGADGGLRPARQRPMSLSARA